MKLKFNKKFPISQLGNYDSPYKESNAQQYFQINENQHKDDNLENSNGKKNRSLDKIQLPQIGQRTIAASPLRYEQVKQLPKIKINKYKLENDEEQPNQFLQIRTPIQNRNPIQDDKFIGGFLQLKQSFNNTDKSLLVASRTKAGLQNSRQIKINQDSIMNDPDILHTLKVQDQFLDCVHAFGVFDGHGINGHLVSQYIKNNLPRNLYKYLSQLNGIFNPTDVRDCIKQAYLNTNQEIWNQEYDTALSGSTVVSVIIIGRKIYCANTGDSRAIMCRIASNGRPNSIGLSIDHKPTLQKERDRIIRLGGRIDCQKDLYGHPLGPLRVWMAKLDLPGLAMTRSFGDKIGAQAGVIAEPEILEFELTSQDAFIVIASDGVWEYLNDMDVIKLVYQHYQNLNVESAADSIIHASIIEWKKVYFGRDDISCVVIFFNQIYIKA